MTTRARSWLDGWGCARHPCGLSRGRIRWHRTGRIRRRPRRGTGGNSRRHLCRCCRWIAARFSSRTRAGTTRWFSCRTTCGCNGWDTSRRNRWLSTRAHGGKSRWCYRWTIRWSGRWDPARNSTWRCGWTGGRKCSRYQGGLARGQRRWSSTRF